MFLKKYIIQILLFIFICVISINNCGSGYVYVDKNLKTYGITEENISFTTSIPKLEKALKDKDEYVRRYAAKALGDFGKSASEAVPSLLLCTADHDAHVRSITYSSLSRILSINSIIPILTKGLSDNHYGVRHDVLGIILSFNQTNDALNDESLLQALKIIRDNDEYQPCRDKANQIIQRIEIQKISLINNDKTIKSEIGDEEQVKINKNLKNKYTIAVSSIDVIGATETAGIAIDNRLYSELFKSQQFVVLERQKMEEILKEQGFQQTGCTSNECLVEMGKLLNVRLMVGGSVTKVSRLHSIDLRIIDVQTGEVVSVSTEDVMGSIEDVLLTGLKNSIAKLINNFNY